MVHHRQHRDTTTHRAAMQTHNNSCDIDVQSSAFEDVHAEDTHQRHLSTGQHTHRHPNREPMERQPYKTHITPITNRTHALSCTCSYLWVALMHRVTSLHVSPALHVSVDPMVWVCALKTHLESTHTTLSRSRSHTPTSQTTQSRRPETTHKSHSPYTDSTHSHIGRLSQANVMGIQSVRCLSDFVVVLVSHCHSPWLSLNCHILM